MPRALFALATWWFLCVPANPQDSVPASVTVSLAEQRSVYKVGEPIVLRLQFMAKEPGLSLNRTTTEPASPIDDLVVTPMAGVFPWLEDQARGHRYAPDYMGLGALAVGEAQTITLPVNAVYRFDAPGHYSIRVVTDRVLRGGLTAGRLKSNVIAFDIEAMGEAEEADRAAELERLIRQASELREAQKYAEELDWLTGDASTKVKLSLFLHPKVFYPFGVDVSRGLWVARNRRLVVEELEQALRDPSQSLSDEMSSLTAALKARLETPFNPASADAPLATQRMEGEYLKLIAASLQERNGEGLVEAARMVFVRMAQQNDTTSAEFAAAREILITHFGEVNEFDVDSLLNAWGRFLEDGRITPALKQILKEQQNPTMNLERTAALKQLMKIAPAESRGELVEEVCGDNPTLLQGLDDAPFKTLPEIDGCVMRKIHAAAGDGTKGLKLQWASEFAARFASGAIYDDLFALYQGSGRTWDAQTQGYVLGYFMRWDATRGSPLLERALPANAATLNFSVLYALNRVFSPPLASFWRQRMASAPTGQAGQAAWLLSENGGIDDKVTIRTRLERLRAKWKGLRIPEAEARLEADLARALMYGRNWQASDLEKAWLHEGCLSNECESLFQARLTDSESAFSR